MKVGRQTRLIGAEFAVARPVSGDPGLQLFNTHVLGVVEHQVGLQGFVAHLRRFGLPDLLLQAQCHARHEGVTQQVCIGQTRLRAQLVALVQAQAEGQWHVCVAACGTARHQIQGLERRQCDPHIAEWQFGDRIGQLGELGSGLFNFRYQCLVAHKTHGPTGQQADRYQGQYRITCHRYAATAALYLSAAPTQVRFAEHHIPQQPGEEETAARSRRWRGQLPLQAKGARNVAQYPVNRAALLGSAGEIHPAQHRRLSKSRRLKHLLQKGLAQPLDAGELLRESKQGGALGGVSLLFHPRKEAAVQALDKRVEIGIKLRGSLLDLGIRLEWKGHSPDLRSRLAAHVRAVLGKAGDEIAFGDHDIQRKAQPECFVQLLDAGTDFTRVLGTLFGGLREQVRDAQRDDRAIERLAWPEPFQQGEKTGPCRCIYLLVAALRGVPARSVEQHGFVSEPPVAVAGTANPFDLDTFAALLF